MMIPPVVAVDAAVLPSRPRTVRVSVGFLSKSLTLLLVLPAALHLAAWWRWEISIPTLILGAWALSRAWKAAPVAEPFEIPLHRLALLASAVAAWITWSGICGNVERTPDYWKHDSILHELIVRPWPVIVDGSREGPCVLTYYLGWYLPGALVGKALGIGAARLVQGLMAWAATTGSLLLVLRRFKGAALLPALFLLVFTGPDLLGVLLNRGKLPPPGTHIDWWAGSLNYPSLTSYMYWTPQHAVPAILATTLLLVGTPPASAAGLAVPLVATLSWSPFITLGLAPLAAIAWWRLPTRSARLAMPCLCILLGAPFAAIYLGKVPDDHGWGWQQQFWGYFPFVTFMLLKVAWPGAMAWLVRSELDAWERRLVAVSIACLLLLPVYYYGYFNDLGWKCSLPSLFILGVAAWSGWVRLPRRTWKWGAFLVMAILGLGGPINEFVRPVMNPRKLERIVPIQKLALPYQYVTPLKGRPLLRMLRVDPATGARS